jgi:hypothetical protein
LGEKVDEELLIDNERPIKMLEPSSVAFHFSSLTIVLIFWQQTASWAQDLDTPRFWVTFGSCRDSDTAEGAFGKNTIQDQAGVAAAE